MNQKKSNQTHEQISSNVGEISAIDLLIVVAKYKRSIIGVTLGVAVLSAGISYALPNVFQASTKLLPPQQTQSSAAALLSQLGGIAGAAAAAGAGLKNPNDLYVGMLKSRTIADRLISRFDLKRIYDTDSLEKARKKLASNTVVTAGKDGLIEVIVEDENRQLVAPVANAYVSELFRLMKTLAVTDAAQRRLFYERQLESTKENLASAEAALKNTMDTRGVVSVDSESRAILETVARLKAQASAKEIQLSSMGAFVTKSNPEFRRVEEELSGIRAELTKLENGRGSENLSNSTSGGLQNIKLLRDLKYQQMLYEALAKQYEVARIDEAKDPSVIQVLDQAQEPERKAKPHRLIIVILATIAAFFGMIFCSFVLEAKKKTVASDRGAAKWAEFVSHLQFK